MRSGHQSAGIARLKAMRSSSVRSAWCRAMPLASRCARPASRPSPGTRMGSCPGNGGETRISAKLRVAAAMKSCTSPKAAMSMAATNWPVFVGLVVSAVKSTTSEPKAAPFSTPASRPMARARPKPFARQLAAGSPRPGGQARSVACPRGPPSNFAGIRIGNVQRGEGAGDEGDERLGK